METYKRKIRRPIEALSNLYDDGTIIPLTDTGANEAKFVEQPFSVSGLTGADTFIQIHFKQKIKDIGIYEDVGGINNLNVGDLFAGTINNLFGNRG